MAFTISLGPKRKNRYFLIAYASKKVPMPPADPNAPGQGTAPVRQMVALKADKGSNDNEFTFGSLSLILEPDPKTSDKTPHINRNQAIQLIQKQEPDHNHIAIMNIVELSEKNFLQWNG